MSRVGPDLSLLFQSIGRVYDEFFFLTPCHTRQETRKGEWQNQV